MREKPTVTSVSSLRDLQQAEGAILVAQGENWLPLHYGDPHQEYLALRQETGLLDLSHWGKITVTGPDRKNYLHGLVTNEVKKLSRGQGNYSLFLSPQGKIQADLWVFDRGEDLLLITYADLRTPLLESLEKYLIMDDAEIRDESGAYVLLSLQGPQAGECLARVVGRDALPVEEYGLAAFDTPGGTGYLARVSHTGETGFDCLLPPGRGVEMWTRLLEAGARPAGLHALDTLRVEAGIPRCGKDLDDRVIPQEAGLRRALSFTKGCYVGQEVVARLHFRGHVNREWTGFVLKTEDLPQETVKLWHGGKEVGAITSACYSYTRGEIIGLGFLRCKLRGKGTVVTAMETGREYPAVVDELPLVHPVSGRPAG